MKFSEHLGKALSDYRMLLNKGYPPASTLALIVNRYRLKGEERSLLFRGVFPSAISDVRKRKLVHKEQLANSVLHIDSLNQILTVACYLSGKRVFISSDGLLRDAFEIHGKSCREDILERATLLVLEHTGALQPMHACFHIDLNVTVSEVVMPLLKGKSGNRNSFSLLLSDTVDKKLCAEKSGVICSSDSQIVDRACLPVFDLACSTLSFHFSPDFLDFSI